MIVKPKWMTQNALVRFENSVVKINTLKLARVKGKDLVLSVTVIDNGEERFVHPQELTEFE